jgi:hypothetical protein
MSFFKRFVGFALCLTALLIVVSSCGVSKAKLEKAQQRINALKAKGVPDSGLSEAIVLLYDAREANNKEDWGRAGKSGKEMMKVIARAEDLYNQKIVSMKPEVDNMRQQVAAARKDFTNLQLKKLDSLAAKADSFYTINWMLQAYDHAQIAVDAISRLKFDEQRSNELKPRLPGTWICLNETKSKANKDINAVEKKIFTFNPDFSVKLIENKKGQSATFLKEDWEFQSYGKWDVTGDTICLFINRFVALKQDFTKGSVDSVIMARCAESGGAPEDCKYSKKDIHWKLEPGPRYDSTITDHSQDRYVTFADLQADFKKQ